MSKPTDWFKAEQWVIEGLFQAGYRRVSGEGWERMTCVLCDWLDGRIGKTTARRKFRRHLRRLDKRIALGGPLFDLVQVQA